MNPAAFQRQVDRGLDDFLRASFWSSTPGMEQVVEHLLSDEGVLRRGPYVTLQMPFEAGENPLYFPDVPLGFQPHRHQEQTFARLAGRRKECTLVATGTGSGKTESFLLPILDHCLKEAHQPGVKAILIYPMNALATDQAARIAQRIHDNDALRGRVRAGLYVGGQKKGGKTARGATQMGPTQVITDRQTLQDAPPDILLTNYKMLDYLLLRASDQRIWQHNAKGILRFVVVDEIHTFDGAQGTDLACLLRRLKRRLEVDDGALCCVGTSATLGGPSAAAKLRDYAERVFGEPFDDESVIGESRLSEADFLEGWPIRWTGEPGPEDKATLDPIHASDPESWLAAQERLWLGEASDEDERDGVEPAADERPEDRHAVDLGERLREHATFQALLGALRGETVALDRLLAELQRARSAWRDDSELGRLALISLLALAAKARRWRHELDEVAERRRAVDKPRPVQPFLDQRIQVWQRELKRMVATVGVDPQLRHDADLDRAEKGRHLPMVHCRECGSLGWATVVPRDRQYLYRTGDALRSFYTAYFGNDPRVRFLYPVDAWPAGDLMREQAIELDCETLTKVDRAHDRPRGETLRVVPVADTVSTATGQQLSRDCVFCRARDSLTLIGFRAASLTAVTIDQVFASRFNPDKKLLTFSDSVQDAAHRAGFFGHRTWRGNLRIAMRRTIEALGEPTLAELADQLGPWWHERMDESAWVSTFLAPSMAWLHDWDALRQTGELPSDSDLPAMIRRRLAFEVVQEFGLQTGIGRSLHRTGTACVFLDGERLDQAVAALIEPLRNEVPGLREVSNAAVRHFVVGLVHHLRQRGGILARSLPPTYIETSGRDVHAFKRDKALPSYGRTSRLPAFLTDRPGRRFETWGRTGRGGDSWYQRWADRSLSEERVLTADAASVYLVALPILARAKVLGERVGSKGAPVWGVDETALRVGVETAWVACSREDCRSRRPVAAAEAAAWVGLPCVTARCEGSYQPESARAAEYFGRLYTHGDLQRIYTEEHTGLLERAERERVEREFKANDGPADDPDARRPWYPNLLSCTPTLEMGIDIGDLSTAILCSVPPAQANYLQRIGRAGRRDGNAFLLTVAAARSHDLYFFAEPREMFAGEVAPPGVFLDAPAVLERQLAAFCMDRWVAETGADAELPGIISLVFSHLDGADPEHFPFNWLRFVEAYRPTLLREFAEMFEGEVSATTHEHLRAFLEGGDDLAHTLESKLLDALHRERKQRNALSKKVRALYGEIQRMKAREAQDDDHDEQVKALQAEYHASRALVKAIDKRLTLGFLTEEGLLPNYAFPESAVRLRSVIWRRKKNPSADDKSAYETWTYEYARSPSSALSELAPGADFYASGRRVQIAEVDLASSTIETWRFCPECSHAESLAAGDEATSCPACGEAGWRDSGQKQRLLRLLQVTANSSDRESRITDDADDRTPRFFHREMSMTVDRRASSSAWRVGDDRSAFGFEYLSRATFRDINFGEPADQGPKNRIGGQESVRQGFEVCARCGKVQTPGKAREHTLACPTRRGDAPEVIEPCLYLYREFSSEALRLLLPLDDLTTSRQLHSFIAALRLALESYFSGDVGHLQTMVSTEPEAEGRWRRQVLVLYDAVPGGTAYLQQLVTPNDDGEVPLTVALDMALQRIEGCTCWADGRDGCYRCLYAYRDSRDMDDTSARTASELLRKILAGRKQIEPIARLGDISVSSHFDSALEARFIEALRTIEDSRGRSATLTRRMVNGKAGFLWSLGDAEWLIEPQVAPERKATLGVGVSIDFVLRPTAPDDDRRIAVFLDGWTFHRERIGQDLRQRMALVASGGWDVWSLTHWDLEAHLSPKRSVEPTPEMLAADRSRLRGLLQGMGLAGFVDWVEQSSFAWLARELNAEDRTPWQALGQAALAACMRIAGSSDRRAWTAFVNEAAPPIAMPFLGAREPRQIAALSRAEHDHVEWMAIHDGKELSMVCRLDDRPEVQDAPTIRPAWRGVLRLFQWLAHAGDVWFVTTSSVDRQLEGTGLDYGSLAQARYRRPEEAEPWGEWEQVEEEYRAVGERLMAEGVVEPVIGAEIPDRRDDVWTEAEMVWEDRRIALTSREAIEDARGDVAAGWTVYVLEDLDDRVLAELIVALTGEES